MVLAAAIAVPVAQAQTAPAADPQKQTGPPAAAKPPADTTPPPSTPSPSTAQQFPFPEDDSKAKEIPELHTAPAPDAPLPGAPAPRGGQGTGDAGKFPFPGDAAPQPAGGGFSSSSDTAPSTVPGSEPSGRRKLTLQDVGSSGRIDTGRAEEYLRVADFYAKDGNYAGAYLRYKDAVEFNPDDPDAHFGLAEMAHRQGKTSEAIEQYKACLKADPQGRHAKESLKMLKELQPETSTKSTAGER